MLHEIRLRSFPQSFS